MQMIAQLSLPFLALCLVAYTSVMGWLIFRREKGPDRIKIAESRTPPKTVARHRSARIRMGKR
jgi:hypothetical protein